MSAIAHTGQHNAFIGALKDRANVEGITEAWYGISLFLVLFPNAIVFQKRVSALSYVNGFASLAYLLREKTVYNSSALHDLHIYAVLCRLRSTTAMI